MRRIDKNGYYRNYGKLEHREIYQTYYHCCLLKWGHVHHLNGNKEDNRIENLQGITIKKHNSLHSKSKIGTKYNKIRNPNLQCNKCKSKTTYIGKKDGYENWNHIDENLVCRKCYSYWQRNERGSDILELDFNNIEGENVISKLAKLKTKNEMWIGEKWLPKVNLKFGKVDAKSRIEK